VRGVAVRLNLVEEKEIREREKRVDWRVEEMLES
jgi:hypothetical protein